jgi:hypothetical protein
MPLLRELTALQQYFVHKKLGHATHQYVGRKASLDSGFKLREVGTDEEARDLLKKGHHVAIGIKVPFAERIYTIFSQEKLDRSIGRGLSSRFVKVYRMAVDEEQRDFFSRYQITEESGFFLFGRFLVK